MFREAYEKNFRSLSNLFQMYNCHFLILYFPILCYIDKKLNRTQIIRPLQCHFIDLFNLRKTYTNTQSIGGKQRIRRPSERSEVYYPNNLFKAKELGYTVLDICSTLSFHARSDSP